MVLGTIYWVLISFVILAFVVALIFALLFAGSMVTRLLNYLEGMKDNLIHRDTRPSPLIHCRMLHDNAAIESSEAPDHRSEARLRIDPKVLVLFETTYSRLGRDIAELSVYNRIKAISSAYVTLSNFNDVFIYGKQPKGNYKQPLIMAQIMGRNIW